MCSLMCGFVCSHVSALFAKGGKPHGETWPLGGSNAAFGRPEDGFLLTLGVPFKQQAARYAVAYGRVKRVFRILPAPLQYQDFNL